MLTNRIDQIARDLTSLPKLDEADAATRALRLADQLTALAVSLVTRAQPERRSGLMREQVLRLSARRTGSEAASLTHAGWLLGLMPATAECFARGVISWPQLRLIMQQLRSLRAAQLPALDPQLAREAQRQADAGADAESLVDWVADQVWRLQASRMQHRADHAFHTRGLWSQASLDGEAGVLWARGDAASLASILEAVEAAAPAPSSDPDGPPRAQQRFDGLVSLCEHALAGSGATGGIARPRLYATIDVTTLAGQADGEAARVFWQLAGRPGRLSLVSARALACDAEIIPLVLADGAPILVGSAAKQPSDKIRHAILVRDQRCRFPGCRHPAAWADIHHIIPRPDGTHEPANLVTLCRSCHRRVHRHGWKITHLLDGSIRFTGPRYHGLSPPPTPHP